MALASIIGPATMDLVSADKRPVRHCWPALLAVFLLSVLMVACSTSSITPGTREAPRTIMVSATDALEFTPSRITVVPGETVRFLITNEGVGTHEFAIGSEAALLNHAMVMSHRGMSSNTAQAVWLPPGQTVEMIHTFGSATDIRFACMVFDHYPRGMQGEFEFIAAGS